MKIFELIQQRTARDTKLLLKDNPYSNNNPFDKDFNIKNIPDIDKWVKTIHKIGYEADPKCFFLYRRVSTSYKRGEEPLKLHIALSDPSNDLVLINNIIYTLSNQELKLEIIHIFKICNPASLKYSNHDNKRVCHQVPITIYFTQNSKAEQIYQVIDVLEKHLNQLAVSGHISTPGDVADSDISVGNYCRLTLDHDKNGKYLDGVSDSETRQNLMANSPKVKRIQALIAAKSDINRIKFEEKYRALYKKESFFSKNPYSTMLTMLNEGNLTFDDIKNYVAKYPFSRSAEVYNSLFPNESKKLSDDTDLATYQLLLHQAYSFR